MWTRAAESTKRVAGRSRQRRPWRVFRPSHHLHVALEAPAARGMAQLPERLRLDLPDALARHVERGSDLLQRARAAVLGEPEAKPDHLGLALGEGLEHLVHLVLQHRERGGLRRRDDAGVLDKVAEAGVIVLADRAVQGD